MRASFTDFLFDNFEKHLSVLQDNTALKNLFNERLGVDYTLEERIQHFLFAQLRSEIDVPGLRKQNFLRKKKKKASKNSTKGASQFKFSFAGVSAKQLIDKFEFMSEFFLLARKSCDSLRAKAAKAGLGECENSRLVLEFAEQGLGYLQEVLIHLMFHVFLKKFNVLKLEESSFAGCDDLSHFASFFRKNFVSHNTLYAVYSSLPKDIRQSLRESTIEAKGSFTEAKDDENVLPESNRSSTF